MSKDSRISYQIQLLEQLNEFLTNLQARLQETEQYYDKQLGKMEAHGLFLEKIETQRKEYFTVTKQGIQDIIELLEQKDKPFVRKNIDYLNRILRVK